MRHLATVENEFIGCRTVGFEDGEVFSAEMIVTLFSLKHCKEER